MPKPPPASQKPLVEYGRAVPVRWLLARLGLTTDTAPGKEASALRHYRSWFLPPDSHDVPYVSYKGCFVDPQTDVVEWSWAGVLHPRLSDDADTTKRLRQGVTLTKAKLYGLIWRGEIAARIGLDAAKDLLADHPPASYGAADLLAKELATELVFPAGEPPRNGTRRIPVKQQWIGLLTGVGGVCSVVVDLDCHRPEDRPRFEAAVALFLRHPGIPAPHLIVSTPSGGRHMYWFATGWSPGWPRLFGKMDPHSVLAPAVAMRSGLQRHLGLKPLSGAVEVFPKGAEPASGMPGLPFGPGYRLCDETGEPVAESGMDSVVKWYLRTLQRPIRRIPQPRFYQFGAGPDPDGLAKHLLGLLPKPKPAIVQPVTTSPVPTATTLPSHRATLREVFEVLRDGPTAGGVNDEMPLLARFYRRNLNMDDTEGVYRLVEWVSPRIGNGRSEKSYESRAIAFWKRAAKPVPAPPLAFVLTPADVSFVAGLVVDKFDAIERAQSFTVFWLSIIGIGRNLHGVHADHEGWLRWVSLSSAMMKGWAGDDYRLWLNCLIKEGFLNVDVEHFRFGSSRRENNTTRLYSIRVPDGSAPVVLPDRPAVSRFVVKSLTDEEGTTLVGQQQWAAWKKQVVG